MEKLTKEEKVKRLEAIKIGLEKANSSWDYYMCHIYDGIYNDGHSSKRLFLDIPELYEFRPKGLNLHYSAWCFREANSFEERKKCKIEAIDKAIKLIQSK